MREKTGLPLRKDTAPNRDERMAQAALEEEHALQTEARTLRKVRTPEVSSMHPEELHNIEPTPKDISWANQLCPVILGKTFRSYLKNYC